MKSAPAMTAEQSAQTTATAMLKKPLEVLQLYP